MADHPLHVAIIPDGNRRWARARKWQPWKGHEEAIENFRTITEFCRKDPRVSHLTVWCFSTENWKRDPEEIRHLMELLEAYIIRERAEMRENNVRLVHSGRLDRVPASLAALIRSVCEETKDAKSFTLHLAIDYGGKDEVVRAIRSLSDPSGATEEAVRASLDHPELPDIDLVIRTSGEQRTSNFFLWQAAYAEWVFLEKHFPDFTVEDLTRAIEGFQERKRRFGQ